MEKEEILKGNKLIAESGLSSIVISNQFKAIDSSSFFIPKKWYYPNIGYYNDDSLLFHSSWDWLMPVWHKFRDLRFKDETKSKLHTNYVARLAQDLAYGTISEFFNNIQIAIEWYNQQSINQNTEQK